MFAPIDPELSSLIADFPRLSRSNLAEVRSLGAAAFPQGSGVGADGVVERRFEIEAQDRTVSVVEHRLEHATPLGVVIHIHGGGFVAGSASDPFTRRWCSRTAAETGAIVLAIDYRLAPEHPYPAALDDCHDVLQWVREHRAELQLHPEAPIVLHGQSAGGALAAGTALRSRDGGESPVSLLILDAPVTDDRCDSDSMIHVLSPVWSRTEAQLSWEMYLGPARGQAAPSYAAPARADSLDGLPATFVAVNGVDALRDEALEFATRLVRAGVSVDLRLYARTVHGSGLIGEDTAPGRSINGDQRSAIRSALVARELQR